MAALHDLEAPGKRITRRSPVVVYSWGACAASVCAPTSMTAAEVVVEVDRQLPTGLSHGWALSDDETFAGGKSNPCVCDQDPGRVHRLLSC